VGDSERLERPRRRFRQALDRVDDLSAAAGEWTETPPSASCETSSLPTVPAAPGTRTVSVVLRLPTFRPA
jgi:hypothetical protein